MDLGLIFFFFWWGGGGLGPLKVIGVSVGPPKVIGVSVLTINLMLFIVIVAFVLFLV